MPLLSRHGGPFQGPRLIVALIVVTFLFFWISSPGGSRPTPIHNERPDAPTGAEEKESSGGSLYKGPKDSNSLSDKLLDLLKDHTRWGDKPKDKADAAKSSYTEGQPSNKTSAGSKTAPSSHFTPSTDKKCAHVPDTSEILVVLRMPAADLHTEIAGDIINSLHCVDHIIYSTTAQTIQGVEVQDSLAGVSSHMQETATDFKLYQQIEKAKGSKTELEKLKEDHDHNLDKWGIIPSVLGAYEQHKDKKWYLILDRDTYVNLPNLVAWTKKLDASKPIYTGAEVQIQDVKLAQSGAGILLSAPALQRLSTLQPDRKDAWERETQKSCCGDKMLAIALKEAGVNLHYSFPVMQTESPFSLDWSPTHWCKAAVTWHKLSREHVTLLDKAEKAWYAMHAKEGPVDPLSLPPLRFKNIFTKHIVGIITDSPNRTAWDNLSDTWIHTDTSRSQYAHISFEACMAGCEVRAECLQYAWEPNKCKMSSVVRLGRPIDEDAEGRERALSTSGWLLGRIEGSLVREREGKWNCEGKDPWAVPSADFVYEGKMIDVAEAKIEEERQRKAEEKNKEKAEAAAKAKAEGEEARKKEEEKAAADHEEGGESGAEGEHIKIDVPEDKEEMTESERKAQAYNEATGNPHEGPKVDSAVKEAMKIWGEQG